MITPASDAINPNRRRRRELLRRLMSLTHNQNNAQICIPIIAAPKKDTTESNRMHLVHRSSSTILY